MTRFEDVFAFPGFPVQVASVPRPAFRVATASPLSRANAEADVFPRDLRANRPRIAVVIPTRDRGGRAADAVRAILLDDSDFELVVIDQSSADDTVEPLRSMEHDPRLRVIRSSSRGISNARNAGVAYTSADIIAFTDDDCVPEAGWVSALLRVFVEEPATALIFGRVDLPADASDIGYAASFQPDRRLLHGGIPTPDVGLGIGANLAIRREVFEELGGFDPLLGVGAPYFRAGEDMDLLIRALHTGYQVVNATECVVLHLGLRTGADVRALAVGYQIGTGAAFGKHARLAGFAGLRDAWRWTTYYMREALRSSVQRHRSKWGVVCYFVAGAFLTLRYRLDHAHNVFQTRADSR